MAALGLQCCAWVLSTCGHPGFSCFNVWASFVSMYGLLIAAVYLVLENELYGTQASAAVACGAGSCSPPGSGTQAQQLWPTGFFTAPQHVESSQAGDQIHVS